MLNTTYTQCPSCDGYGYVNCPSSAPEDPIESYCNCCGFTYSNEFSMSEAEQAELYKQHRLDNTDH